MQPLMAHGIMDATGDRMKEIKEIDILSLIKIQAVMMAVIGLIVGVIMSLVLMRTLGPASLLAIIGYPIIYLVVGVITSAITAFLYNVLAARIGGVKIQLK